MSRFSDVDRRPVTDGYNFLLTGCILTLRIFLDSRNDCEDSANVMYCHSDKLSPASSGRS